LALVAGPIGTEVIERILSGCRSWLAPGGQAYIEVGETQAQLLAARFGCEVILDQYSRPRFLRV
jgi:methylase of polypeptide subunit release factors